MKPRLYYYPGNANLAPHIVLEEVGCDFELMLVDRTRLAQKSEDYLRLNPNGTIPTFVSGDLVLFEAAAICLHIAECWSSVTLLPPPGSVARAHVYKWLFFLSNTLQPAFMAFRYPETFVSPSMHSCDADAAPLVSAVKATALERVVRAFRVLERSLTGTGPYLLGSQYSVADAYLYMLAWWARIVPNSTTDFPRVADCVAAVAGRPATQRACAAEGIEVFRGTK